MKPNSRIQQFLAFSLLLVFTVQAGLGLWLHRVLHGHPAQATVYLKSHSPAVQEGTASITCACTDQFLIPFNNDVASIETALLFQQFFSYPIPEYQRNSCSEVQRFRPLRAPPVLTV